MKPALLITLSFLLFALNTKLPLAFSDDKSLLAIGPVATGEAFYILATYPPIESEGGGVILGRTRNSTCPLTVLQHYSAGFNGLSVQLTSPQDHFNTTFNVSTSTPLDITFLHKPINCAKSIKWVVVVDDDFPHPWAGVGGAQDYPGKQILNGWFHIQGFNRGYKLVFCPISSTTASSSLGGCKNIGRHQDIHGRRLILTDKDPFHVVFYRVDM